MPQETIKIKLDKINSLFNVFFRDGIDKTSKLERDLLKIQLNSLIKELDSINTNENFEMDQSKSETPIGEVEKVVDLIDKGTKSTIEEKMNNYKDTSISVQKNKEKTEELTAKETLKQKAIIQFIADDLDESELIHAENEKKEFNTNKPTRSLKDVIDLNKSFIFRAELFANNNEAYKTFIDELNRLESEKKSFEFVEKTADQKAWNKEQKVYELLLRAVEKRFLPLI